MLLVCALDFWMRLNMHVRGETRMVKGRVWAWFGMVVGLWFVIFVG
jgi:hypothetical protein